MTLINGHVHVYCQYICTQTDLCSSPLKYVDIMHGLNHMNCVHGMVLHDMFSVFIESLISFLQSTR